MWLFIVFVFELLFGFMTYIYLYKIREIQLRNKRYNIYMESMESFYQLLTKQTQELRKFRHDMQNHIRTMEYMQTYGTGRAVAQDQKKNGESDFGDYIAEVKEIYEIMKPVSFCKNEIVNAVLLIKRKQCKEKQIPMEIMMDNVSVTEISELDFAALLHNLLDNAIEANEMIPDEKKRWIGFEMRMEKENGDLTIILENAVLEKEKILFKTAKENIIEHGFGRKIIGDIVDKYRGESRIEQDITRGTLKEIITFQRILH